VAALTDVINFLLGLMGDEGKRMEFDENPQKALQDAGLDGLSGQDVRDAQLEMCDRGLAGPNGGGGGSGGGGGGGGGRHSGADDPVQAIQHTTATFHVTEVTETNIINVDDRDVIFNDSFNSDDDVTIIDDSFNDSSSVVNDVTAIQDNDTIINDNDTVNIEDNDTTVEGDVVAGPENTGVVGPEVENPPLGIATEDIVGPETEGEVETQVEPETEPAQVIDDEPDLDADAEADVEPEPEPVDAAIG
jgi:hypothetical protein